MLKKKYRICFITGSRAEYGLLKNLIKLFKKDKSKETYLIVTGSHLSKKFGQTINEIKNDKIKISNKINILGNNDSPLAILEFTSLAIKKISYQLKKIKPDLLIILGDRFEIFAAAISASFLKIPICHFHGGESTQGNIDEFIRHSITKMSSLHFVTNKIYKKRVIQLGEHPVNVFNVGSLGIDSIKNIEFLSKKKLEKELSISFKKKIFLVTYHPVTLDNNSSKKNFQNILNVLKNFNDTTIIFTFPNADMDGQIIINLIKKFTINRNNAYFFKSLGQQKYFSLLRISTMVIGNSSSGIIEAPYFNLPTINIGDRQKGRVLPLSVISCNTNPKSILKAIKLGLSVKFKKLRNKNLNEKSETALNSFKIIDKSIKKIKIKKKFFDINF
tara:strand:- start:6133 stop:7296 length:1164 start_codon:yes stop_codon:yes gene_type:complete